MFGHKHEHFNADADNVDADNEHADVFHTDEHHQYRQHKDRDNYTCTQEFQGWIMPTSTGPRWPAGLGPCVAMIYHSKGW